MIYMDPRRHISIIFYTILFEDTLKNILNILKIVSCTEKCSETMKYNK